MNHTYTILIAENNAHFVSTAKEYLESKGYRVLTADSPETAVAILETRWVHLAIIDMRLRNDNSAIDKSGIHLLKNTARQIPKLIWTTYTDEYPDVVAAMKPDGHPLPPAVDFVAKRGGLEELEAAVAAAIAQHVPIPYDLKIAWHSVHDSFQHLTNIVTESNGRLPNSDHANELEDLLRLLFRPENSTSFSQITINKVIISGNGYVILGVYAFRDNGEANPYTIVCGQRDLVAREANNYETAVPRPIVVSNMAKYRKAQTTHFAATAYRLVEGQLDTIQAFAKFYRTQELPQIEQVLTNLYQNNLATWSQQGRQYLESNSLNSYYQTQLDQRTESNISQWLKDNLPELCHKIQLTGLGRIEIDNRTVRVPAHKDVNTFSHPAQLLKKPPTPDQKVVWGKTHGQVTTDTVLVDEQINTWLIDFTQVAEAPLINDFTALETHMKVDLLKQHTLTELLQFECELATAVAIPLTLPLPLLKAFQTIRTIRRHAQELVDCEPATYNLSLFYQSLRYLTYFDQERLYTRAEISPYAHLLLAASVTARFLLSDTPTPVKGLAIDENGREVYVNGRLVDSLSSREYHMLVYFKANEGKTRSLKELVLEAFDDEHYEESSDEARVRNAIKRLREKIEPNPSDPQFIVTVTGQGYKFDSHTIQ